MKEKVLNVFEFQDYKTLLNEDFLIRTTLNSSYSLRAYARDLSSAVSFLSVVMRGKNNLSINSGRKIFQKLGFKDLELEYIDNLIKKDIAKDQFEKQEAIEFINKYYAHVIYKKTNIKLKFLESLNHFIIYGLIERTNNVDDLINITEKLKIPKSVTLNILNDFVIDGYILNIDDKYQINNEMLTNTSDDKIYSITKSFFNLLVDLIFENGGIAIPDRLIHSFILTLDEESYKLAIETHKHYIKKIKRLGKESSGNDKIIFSSDIFFTLK